MRRRLAAVAAALVLLTACGGGGSDDTTTAGSDKSTSSTSSSTDEAGAPSATGDGTEPGDSSEPGDPGGPAAQPGSGGGGGGGAGAPTAATEAPVPPGLKPFTGSYRYHAVGTATINGGAQPVDVQATTLIEDVSATDQRMTESGGQQGSTIRVMRFSADKVELVSLEMKGAVNKRFEPSPPALYSPVPASVGRSWSWDTMSTDKLTRLRQTSRIDRTEQVTVGGQTVDVFVVETDITLTGDINATGHVTSWVSPVYKVVVKAHSKLNGTYATFTFASDVTSDLLALKPS